MHNPSSPWWRSATVAFAAIASTFAMAQAPGVVIVDQTQAGLQAEELHLTQQVAQLFAAQKLLTLAQVSALRKQPVPRVLELAPAGTREHSGVEIAALAQRSFFRIGWCYLCTECEHWHTDLSCGYAITADGAIATCAHVLTPPDLEMQQASLIAVDRAGTVHPVTSIVALHAVMDAAIVTIAATCTPLAFDDQVRPGDRAYCSSRPLEQRDLFTAGMVNRFYKDLACSDDAPLLEQLAVVRMNVSTAWAPGSSGAAVLNTRGNVIGHVAEIHPMNEDSGWPLAEGDVPTGEPPVFDGSKPATLLDLDRSITLLTLHVAIPARGVRALASAAAK